MGVFIFVVPRNAPEGSGEVLTLFYRHCADAHTHTISAPDERHTHLSGVLCAVDRTGADPMCVCACDTRPYDKSEMQHTTGCMWDEP